MSDYSQKVTSSFNERMRLIRLRRKKENLRFQDDQPSRDDAKFVPEPKILFLPAKADEAHSFVERTGHLLRIVRHSFLFLHSSKSGRALQKTSGKQAPPLQKSF